MIKFIHDLFTRSRVKRERDGKGSMPESKLPAIRMCSLVMLFILVPMVLTDCSRPKPVDWTTISVTTVTDEIVNDGLCSLREAILAANTNQAVFTSAGECPAGSATNIDGIGLVDGQTYKLSINGANEDEGLTGDLDIIHDVDPLEKTGVSPTDIILGVVEGHAEIGSTGLVQDRVLHIQSGAIVVLDNVTVRNGNEINEGGGIYNAGSLTLSSVIVSDNQAIDKGGGIYNTGDLTIQKDSKIGEAGHGNEANIGGGIFNDSGSVRISNSRVSGNQAAQSGGISNSGELTISASMIGGKGAGNSATETDGGGISNYGNGTLIIQDQSFVCANTAETNGGGILNYHGTITISKSWIGDADAGNEAASGGGIDNEYGILDIKNSVVSANVARSFGGGISNSGTLTISNSIFGDIGSGNTAIDGGAIANFASGSIVITSTSFIANTADGEGGAIHNFVSIVNAINVTESCFVNNSDTAFFNGMTEFSNAVRNWWGSPSGPGGVAQGDGDTISDWLTYSDFYTEPIMGCPMKTE
jgi:CSLREA domain-containing protein